MFIQLKPILTAGTALVITASANKSGDQIRLTITPSCKDKDSDTTGINTPLVITGSAEELDAELPATLTGYVAKRQTGAEALAVLDKQIEAETKAANERLKTEKNKGGNKPAAAAPAKPAAPVTPPKPAPEATKAQPALF
jgi:PRTRC genetic system protein E